MCVWIYVHLVDLLNQARNLVIAAYTLHNPSWSFWWFWSGCYKFRQFCPTQYAVLST